MRSIWPRVFAAAATLLLAVVAAACSGASDSETSCEYRPFGRGYYVAPASMVEFADADILAKFLIKANPAPSGLQGGAHRAELVEVVLGDGEPGTALELMAGAGACLETGREYYLFGDRASSSGDVVTLRGPWSQFPVINGRITLHSLTRSDQVIGRYHGLDEVLFKRRILEDLERAH